MKAFRHMHAPVGVAQAPSWSAARALSRALRARLASRVRSKPSRCIFCYGRQVPLPDRPTRGPSGCMSDTHSWLTPVTFSQIGVFYGAVVIRVGGRQRPCAAGQAGYPRDETQDSMWFTWYDPDLNACHGKPIGGPGKGELVELVRGPDRDHDDRGSSWIDRSRAPAHDACYELLLGRHERPGRHRASSISERSPCQRLFLTQFSEAVGPCSQGPAIQPRH